MTSTDGTVIAPYIVAPTYEWDGDDGSWSTFAIEVGTPPQTFRVLPATVGEEVWLPTTEGCEGVLSVLSDCGDLRGVNDFDGSASRGFQRNASSSWSLLGIYQLDTEQNLFHSSGDEGFYGRDDVALGSISDTAYGASIPDTVVVGIATEDFWLGSLGLGMSPGSYSSLSSSVPSLLVSMKARNITSSLSYGYTAGQSYVNPRVPGSLILGGYDEARIKSGVVSTLINTTTSTQSLQVQVQSIIASGTLSGVAVNVLPAPITANIDSATSQIWLPEPACDVFASAFGLEYDDSTGLYLVNNTIHTELQASPPSVTFTIGGNAGSSGTTNVELNYNAFDLDVGVPLYNSSRPYFPLRRAANESQYTLGRTFLQEAYIIVDWENGNLTVGQAVGQNATTSVRSVYTPSQSPASSAPAVASGTPHHKVGISSGAIAGIVVVVIALLAIGAGSFFFLRRRRARRADSNRHQNVESAAPEYLTDIVENYPPEKSNEKHASEYDVHEVDKTRPAINSRHHSELSDTQIYELDHSGPNGSRSRSPVDRELMGTPILELEGSPYSDLASELDVGYGRTESPHPPESGTAQRVSIAQASPRLIDEMIRSSTVENLERQAERTSLMTDRPVSVEPSVSNTDLPSRARSPDLSDVSDGLLTPAEISYFPRAGHTDLPEEDEVS